MDPKSFTDLAQLPWQAQLVFGAGYCAYRIAYVGIRHTHKGADTIFLTLAFGLVAALVLSVTGSLPTPTRLLLGFAATFGAGMLWRAVGIRWVRAILRKTGYSWSDDTESAWQHFAEDSNCKPTQLTVETVGGQILYCSNASAVANYPLGPYVLGANGDVLMYVDSAEEPGGKKTVVEAVHDQQWGSLITYVPRDQIKRVSVRLTAPSEGAAGWKALVQAVAGYWRRLRG